MTDVMLSGGNVLHLIGGASDRFVFKVSHGFTLSGSSAIRVNGGATGTQPSHVEHDILDAGPDVMWSGSSRLDGTVIALDRRIINSTGVVTGQEVSRKEIIITSGASVVCECPTPPE